jgi:putative ABC transport system permease protein
MFWRILLASLRHQRARLGIAVLAMALGSALVSGLLNLSGDIGGQVGQELRAYGANILIRPKEQSLLVGMGGLEFGEITAQQTLPEESLESIKQVQGVVGVLPYVYVVVDASKRPVIPVESESQAEGDGNNTTIVGNADRPAILTGTDFIAVPSINAWWQIQGRWPKASNEILAGRRAAEVFNLAPGDSLAVSYGEQTQTLQVVGVLETGAAEDDQLIGSLSAVQTLTSQPGQVGLVMVSALTTDRSLNAVADEIQGLLPSAEVRPLAQFAQAETKVLNKVRLLIGLVAALVMLAGALTVAGTLNTMVIERRTEIGLMKALGAADNRVANLFLVEAVSIGIFGGVAGYLGGLVLALAIGWKVFDAMITPTLWALPGTLLLGLVVAWAAGLLPVQRALKIDPVITLRGE